MWKAIEATEQQTSCSPQTGGTERVAYAVVECVMTHCGVVCHDTLWCSVS